MELSTQTASAFRPSSEWNHDVFLSFRGEDTRLSFVSHLYHELQLRGIKTFKDDPKLERGTPISSELFNAIEESRLAIVVLSPNYASSSWCLDELTKILQCMKSKSTVLPVFYHVDPSDVRKQTGSFACAFTEHEERFREDIERVKTWRAALTEVANLSGFDSKNECERKLVEKIVNWVWVKVHHRFKLLDSTELVGMKFIREQVDLLSAHPTDDVRFIGIWGMGGIGKPTIAQLVYDSISIHFDVSCFLANVREVSQRGKLVKLQRQLLSPILKDQFTQVWDEQWGTSVIKNCLYNKKVLLILDDVSESSQLEKLAGEKDWFGKGSIIIITTRDKRLLVQHDIHISYKVEALGHDDALELFSRNAFKKNVPEEGFLELSRGFVNYARCLPLALKLLGCLVYKRDQDEWKSELDKLRKIPKLEIIDLLKISYDGLDEMNKDILLDVAFFHTGKKKEEVIEILDSCGLCGCVGINDLIQKSLLTISNRNVEMHDLIQEMALEIVRQECPDEPGRRSRLCNHDDISRVFINNTATDKIKGIRLRMATLEKANWNCEAFSKMLNLKFLEFDNVIISSSPRILPNSLRSIKWSSYPSEFLPSGFQPNFLIELEMPKNKLVRLWDGRMDLPNLKKMNLFGSENLTTTPDFSGIPNLEVLYFGSCTNLVEIHSSIVDLKCLMWLDLDLCSKIDKLPEKLGEMESLVLLELKGTSIRQLPRSVVGLKNLFRLSLRGNGSLPKRSRFWWGLSGLYQNRNGFVLSSLDGLSSLYYLNLSNRGLCEGDLPSDICCLSNLEQLMLSGNNFVSLPASIGCLSKLQVLKVKKCLSLEQLPDLSKLIRLVDIRIAGCTSLKMLPHHSSLVDINRIMHFPRFNCANCFVLVDNEGSDSIILKMLQRYLQFQFQPQLQPQLIPTPLYQNQFEIVTPGREIPEWFRNQSLGYSLTVKLPLDSCTTWIGIALCAVFEVQAHLSEFHSFRISCSSLPPGLFSSVHFKIGDVVSDHLSVIFVSCKQFEKIRGRIKVLFTSYYFKDGIQEESCASVKCGFRLVHDQDVEQLNQMMNKCIIESTTTCPTKSADAQGQQRHDDEDAGPSGSGDDDALVLFSRNAFKTNEPAEGYLELSKGFVKYARGLPLALKLLGCLVYKRDPDEWKSELDKLRKIPNSGIFDLLKLSYDGLDWMNKEIFLDVAFFHKWKGKEKVIEILDSCGLSGRIGINALIQKSLLTISYGIVEMHDLIQEMALEIVRRECPDEPGRRSRLCNYDDISRVFINNTATDKIKGIRLRMATLERANWNCEAFSKMLNLKFLEFDNVIISSSLIILPNSLRSIKWSSYPSEFLPSGFQPKFLIALEMPHSKLVRLWNGRKDFPKLKKMNLSDSENLTTTPDFSGIPNLEELDFRSCKNLVEIHPSIADLKCLEMLFLSSCSKLKKIPEFSGQMKNLSWLSLQEMSIVKLPSSIGCLAGLTNLTLWNCKNLLGLPSEICNLKSLEELDPYGCSKIDKLPENIGEMESLTRLDLDGTSIRQLPRSVVGLKKLDSLDLGRSGSQPNTSRFWWGLSGLYQNRNGFVLSSLDGLLSLTCLDLSNRGLCEGDLPSDIGCLSSLEVLKLSGNNFVSLPASIGCLSKLELFWVNGCQRLQQLPDLSKLISLVDINIAGCTFLKMLHLSSNCSFGDSLHEINFDCANCFVLVDNEGSDSIILKMLHRYLQLIPRPRHEFEIVTPGREIPEWFSNRSLGDSLTVELPLDSCTTWIGIALCAVFEVQAHLSEFHDFIIQCSFQGTQIEFTKYFEKGEVVSPHLWVIYVPREKFETISHQIKGVLLTTDYNGYYDPILRLGEIRRMKFGFRLVHEQDVEQLKQMMMNKSIIKSTTTCPTKSAEAQGQQSHDDEDAGPSGSGSSHQKSLLCNTHGLSEKADQDELNNVDEARSRKRKKIEVIGTDL